ncbi:protein serine/threonine kinase, putative, partial [Entamoeba invadens IP1]
MYLNESNFCVECPYDCTSCLNSEKCITCLENRFLQEHKCLTSDELSAVCDKPLPSGQGCAFCKDGYYRSGDGCKVCNEGCATCTDNIKCNTCQSDYFMSYNYGVCKPQNATSGCSFISVSLGCTNCISGYYLYHKECEKCEDNCVQCTSFLRCEKCASGLILKNWACKPMSSVKEFKEKMLHISNIPDDLEMVKIYQNIFIEKLQLDFKNPNNEGELLVNQPNIQTLRIGNIGKTVKKLIPVNTESFKYEMQCIPCEVPLKKNKMCTFTITLTPFCSTQLKDTLKFRILDLKEGSENIIEIPISYTTAPSTAIDPDELEYQRQIGEGGFGVVFKGKYRNNSVAIKKMKYANDMDDEMAELRKEIEMLDKFRSEYIVHFYGAILIPTHVCMVTEYAKYGSLNKLIKVVKAKEPNLRLKVKMMLDTSKGILYLHNNGILHRDIKPDNILVFSFDEKIGVNAKLTDFGSSRNINLLMTNMTFTKGIGTPVYMAPEILEQKKYKTPADIYSFGVTLYQCLIWNEMYTKDQFPNPWNIAEFVIAGNRLKKEGEMTDQ